MGEGGGRNQIRGCRNGGGGGEGGIRTWKNESRREGGNRT